MKINIRGKPMQNILELKDVSYSYHSMDGETPALSHLSFAVRSGEFLAVIGPSGCGKSTLLNLISGLIKPSSGKIFLYGQEPGNAFAHIGYMLQHDHLFEWRSIYSNVLLGLEIQHHLTPQKKKKAKDLLDTYGLGEFKDARPSELSGGMRQRAALIRTLVLEPDILLLDEPFSALDYQTRIQVGDDIGKIIRKEKKTALLVTHDLSEAVSLADRILVLSCRPAILKKDMLLHFENGQTEPLKRRNAPEFKQYFNEIWKELDQTEGGETV